MGGAPGRDAAVNDSATPLTIGVAIPTYLREEALRETLRGLRAQTRPPDEILVIDQNPASAARAVPSGFRRLQLEAPNLPAARNLALRETGCEVLIFIDDDVALPPDFVAAHAHNYQDPAVDAVGGRVLQPVPPPLPVPARSGASLFDFECLDLASTERQTGIANFRGCNHSVRVRVLRELGGYDEGFIGWAFREDTDAAIRLWKAGRCIVFDPEAVLTHLALPTGGCRMQTWHPPVPGWMSAYPELRFLRKHFHPGAYYLRMLWFHALRKYVLTRRNLKHPWRIPGSLAAYAQAWWYSRRPGAPPSSPPP